jgi:hypothetical protein
MWNGSAGKHVHSLYDMTHHSYLWSTTSRYATLHRHCANPNSATLGLTLPRP